MYDTELYNRAYIHVVEGEIFNMDADSNIYMYTVQLWTAACTCACTDVQGVLGWVSTALIVQIIQQLAYIVSLLT